MLVGYARVSSKDQDLTIQIEQLTKAGCTKVFSEKKSGANLKDRGELVKCLHYVREGDVLMVTRIDRMARSMTDFFKSLEGLKEKGVEFKCLLQPEIDTTTTNGRLVTGILMAIAEFETAVRKERQREGIDKAMDNGVYKRKVGRHKPQMLAYASRLLRRGITYTEAARLSRVPASTLRDRFPEYLTTWSEPFDLKLATEPAGQGSEPTTPSGAEALDETKPQPAAERKSGFLRSIIQGR